jgi:hypothetical protein
MPFGKYREQLLTEIPSDYLEWVLEEVNPRPGLRAAIEQELDSRRDKKEPDDWKLIAQAFQNGRHALSKELERLVTDWQREASMRFHPDKAGGNLEIMKCINGLADQLRRKLQ